MQPRRHLFNARKTANVVQADKPDGPHQLRLVRVERLQHALAELGAKVGGNHDAHRFINAGERPLALYCVSHNAAECGKLLRRTHSGGVTINDWGWHVINHDAPFGGIGNSGMGTYHGIEGFRELSHAKTVFKRHRFFPIDFFYPPYGNLVQRLSLAFFLGKGDPVLQENHATAETGGATKI
jgi:hypothetical protein